MPFPKIFKRHRTTSVIDETTKSRGEPSDYSHVSLAVPIPELRLSTSMPQLVLPENGRPVDVPIGDSLQVNSSANNQAPPVLNITIPADSKLLPPTPASPQVSSARSEVSDGMGEMWRNINDRSANMSRGEKIANKITDTASAVVDAETSTDGVVGCVKTAFANDEVKAIGNTILEGVPAIMSALETLTEIHPFLRAAYLPFKLIYHQETQRRDNDKRRTTLFGKIKDVMFILVELKGIGKDETRNTPDGKPVLGRLASICKDMKKDIEECYNVLNAQERRSVAIKFLKASAWNKELGSYAARFTNTRDELRFALNMRAVVTMDEVNANVKRMLEMFSTMLSPQERDMGRWIDQNGTEKVVLADDRKCAKMIKYGATLAPVTAVSHADTKGRPGSDDETKIDAKAIAALRKEYGEDIQGIIQENMESYSKRFSLGLDDLGKDLGNKIYRQGDRIIRYLNRGPQQRIDDKMVYRVWKDQGWKGSAKTRPLVLALRDYFVERVEYNKRPPPSTEVARKRPVSTVAKDKDDDDDPETDISVPLPDDWMAQYLQIKRLRYLEQALDPDGSGFTTISEVNAFTHARPEDWSFTRWISYWAIGWQIYATKYCVEIEELFGQMMLLKAEIAIKMPGNLRYVNDYIESCWKHVTVLTSSIERYDSDSWLEEKFAGYVQSQESLLKGRLERFRYDIDAIETVSLILRGERIEGSIFILLALLLRRHVAKMHLCLKQEFDPQELWDDLDTVFWVIGAVYTRFLDLKEQFQHRGIADLKLIFEGLSCGLFKNYWEWQHWLQAKYFMENDRTVWTSPEIKKLDPAELKGILAYTDTAESKSEDLAAEKTSTESPATEGTPPAEPPSPVPTLKVLPTNEVVAITEPPPPVLAPPSEAEMSITGTWYGWHWTETSKPLPTVTKVDFKCGERQPESETKVMLTGGGVSTSAYIFTLTGTLDSADQPAGSLALSFERIFTDDWTWIQYNGTFFPDTQVMTGTFKRSIASGGFLFKKVPESSIMCARPMTPVLNAKELWSFATSAVVNEIRRKKPRLPYLCERMTNMRRILALMYDDNRDKLDEAGRLEYSTLLKTFSYEQMTELFKLYAWYGRAGDLQPSGYTCDSCGELLIRSRVVCLECVSTDSPERTVDFCSKSECIAMEIPHRTDVKHLPSHLMVRFQDLFLLRDYYGVKQRAGYFLTYAREIYKPPLPTSPTIDNPSSFPLPASPSANGPAKTNGDLTDGQTSLPAIVDNGPILLPINAQRLAALPLGLPTLDTAMTGPALDPGPEQSQPPASSETSKLPSEAVAPMEELVREELNCIVCHQRVLAPCWKCIICYHAWVCDSCEKVTDELHPWDYVKRYRFEIEKMGGKDDGTAHTVLHAMVRVVGGTVPEAKPDAAADAAAADLSSPLGQWGQIEKRIQDLVTERFEVVNATVERRLDGVDTRLGDVDTRLGNVEKSLTEVETRLTTRLGNIERLLNLIVLRETKS